MQEKFSQAINILHATDINSESLPHAQHADNLSDTKVANAQLCSYKEYSFQG